jgi:hypothetical protein
MRGKGKEDSWVRRGEGGIDMTLDAIRDETQGKETTSGISTWTNK